MADLTDELIAEFLNNPSRPRPRPVGVFASKASPPEEPADLVYKIVSPRRTAPLCMSCHRKLPPGEGHWYYRDSRSLYWWCCQCMRVQCGLIYRKERPRVQSRSRVRRLPQAK